MSLYPCTPVCLEISVFNTPYTFTSDGLVNSYPRKNTKILIMTGFDTPENRDTAMKEGADSFLSKNGTFKSILNQIKTLLKINLQFDNWLHLKNLISCQTLRLIHLISFSAETS